MKPKNQVEYRPVNKLKELPGNPRTINKDQFEKLKASISANADYFEARPCILSDRTGELVVIAGNQRLKAAKALKMAEIPTVLLPNLTEEREKEIIIRDNVENGEWDMDILANEWDVEALDEWGVEGLENFTGEPEEIVEDEVPEPPEEPTTKLGEIWQLGEHRLMCGDSTKKEDVEALRGGVLADMWLTDPPYNVNIGQGGGSVCSMRIQHHRTDGATIKNDNFDNDKEFLDFLIAAYAAAKTGLRDGGAFYIWHACTKTREFIEALAQNSLELRQILVWVKDRLVMGRQDYQWKHEPCLYGWKDGDGHYFTSDRSLTTVIDDRKDVDKMTKGELLSIVKTMMNKGQKTTVIDCERPMKSEDHPTMKPVKLMAQLVQNSSRPGEVVLDTFGGSGTTLIACEQLNRKCYMMELDPHYCDVIIKRWENFTGEKARKIDG